MATVTKNAAKKIENNPYREGGAYHACVAALFALGIGKMNAAPVVVKAFERAMGENLKAFKAVKKRNKNGKDYLGRVIQNLLVLERPDYGRALREKGFEVLHDRSFDEQKQYMFGIHKFVGKLPAVKIRKSAKASKLTAKAVVRKAA